MGKLVLTGRLKGTTLVETLVALTVVTIVLTIGWLTVEWVLRGSHQREDIEADLLMQQMAYEMETHQFQDAATLDTLGFYLEGFFTKAEQGEDLFEIKIKCGAPSGQVYHYYQLLYLVE